MKTVELSVRMQALVNMVSKDSVVCDVGCDHGFVSIYLVQQKIAPKVLAMDIRSGPLERAKEHIAQYHLETYIETRLSDGLENLREGEVDCMVCAGMGGPLMQKILSQGRKKARCMQELILQPQSEISEFRRFLRQEGYQTIQENMIYEEGKYYPIIKVTPVGEGVIKTAESEKEQILWDAFGELLLKQGHPVLKEYLSFSMKHVENLLSHLKEQGTLRAEERMKELEEELFLLHKALLYKEIN